MTSNDADPSPGDPLIGETVGGAVVRRRLGAGGMGLVYEAWQEPPGRCVALKLMRDALSDDEARVRFRHEARVLASIKHPSVAQIYSAGTHTSATEIPYFLMEYIDDALPITDYVAAHALTPRDILRLGARICHAVQAGHTRGIIHRDLKPGNILVDAHGNPKVIDFGIARTTEDDRVDTPKTKTGQLVGTLTYMSPEQFEGGSFGLDVRSDVYALGVILYQLLTGSLPYGDSELGMLEMVGAIQHKTPPPASKLRPKLEHDVDVILQTALAKERQARYASAEALATDIERYLARQPILARAPSTLYQLRLFAKRHKATFAALVAGGAAIVGALIAISFFAASESKARARAEVEAQRATKLLHASTNFIPDVANHVNYKLGAIAGTLRVRRLMAERLQQLTEELSSVEGHDNDPHVAHALGTVDVVVGHVLGGVGGANLGSRVDAVAHLEQAASHFERALRADPDNATFLGSLVSTRLDLVRHIVNAGDRARGRSILEGTAPLLDRWKQSTPEDTMANVSAIDFTRADARLDWLDDNRELALQKYERAARELRDVPTGNLPASHQQTLRLSTDLRLAEVYEAMGRREDAARHFALLRAQAKTIDPQSSNRGALELLWNIEHVLGGRAINEGDLEEAKLHLERAIAYARRMQKRNEGDVTGHGYEYDSRGLLASVHEKLGENKQAIEHLRAGLTVARRNLKSDPSNDDLKWNLRVVLTRLGSNLAMQNEFDEARTFLDEANTIQADRLKRWPTQIVEVTSMAEIENSLSVLLTAEAVTMTDSTAAAKQVERAIDTMQRAVNRLKQLDAEGKLPPLDQRNVTSWTKFIDYLKELKGKLTAAK